MKARKIRRILPADEFTHKHLWGLNKRPRGCGHAAVEDLMDNPPGAGLPTSPTTAWTTLRVDHISTTPAAAKDFLLFSKIKG